MRNALFAATGARLCRGPGRRAARNPVRPAPIVSLALLALSSVPALGQQAPVPSPLEARSLPSPGTARLISAGATVAGTGASLLTYWKVGREAGDAVMVAAWIAGPALGHLYGRTGRRGLAGIAIRATAMLPIALDPDCGLTENTGGCGLAALGAVAVLSATVVDLITIDDAVRERNARSRDRFDVRPYRGPAGSVGAMLTVRY